VDKEVKNVFISLAFYDKRKLKTLCSKDAKDQQHFFFLNSITPGFTSYTWFLFVFVVKKKKMKVMNGVVISCQVEPMNSETITLKRDLHLFCKMLPLEETGQSIRDLVIS